MEQGARKKAPVSEVQNDAKNALEWMKRQTESKFKRTDLQTSSKFKNIGRVRLDAAINLLQAKGYLSDPISDKTTAKPTIFYEINPEFLRAAK
jgi:hypothetical protein